MNKHHRRGSFNEDDPDRQRWGPDTVEEAAYDYRRADGRYAYTVRRGRNPDGGKCFSTDRLNAFQMSDLAYPEMAAEASTRGDEPPVLYRLPELIGAAKKPNTLVLIPEGEKDVETAEALGFVATCNPFGALKWKDEYSHYLSDMDVVVIEDDDDSGHRHADQVARSVRRHAAQTRVLRMPGHNDLSDWVAAKKQSGLSETQIGAQLSTLIDAESKVFSRLTLDDFWAFGPMNQFFFVDTSVLWPAASVDARLPAVPVFEPDGKPVLNKKGEPLRLAASKWLSRHRSVESMTWAPGQPRIIKDSVMTEDGGLIAAPGRSCFNTYRAPPPASGDASRAGRWVDLVRTIYPKDAEHIFDWAAHRVQRPGEKINHALVLTGPPGIGKDTIITAMMRAVGTWNCSEASPNSFFESFNPHVRAVIMRINEAHDLGDVNRFMFYERLKPLAASPPESIAVNEKNIKKYYIPNVVGLIITSNYRTDCLYLPPDDRRHYVAWSEASREDFTENFWVEFWAWLNDGGDQHAAAWLAARDISKFDAKAPPPKTPAFWDIVDAGRSTEESELMDLIDEMKNPDAFTVEMLKENPLASIRDWLDDRRNVKAIGHRLDKCGYTRVGNPDSKDGVWKIKGKRHIVYAKKELTKRDQLAAVAALLSRP